MKMPKRILSVLLAVMLLSLSVPLSNSFRQAYAEPHTSFAATQAALKSTLIASEIPVTLYDGENPQTTQAGYVQPGLMQPDRMPPWPGYTFTHAYLVDPTNPADRLRIAELLYTPAGPDNGLPTGEAYVTVIPANQLNQNFQLLLPESKAAQYLQFEYLKTGYATQIIYAPESPDTVTVEGPATVYRQSNGQAQAYFTVRIPRNSTAQISLSSPTGNTAGAELSQVNDLSTPEQTVLGYKLLLGQNFQAPSIQVNIAPQPKGTLHLSLPSQNQLPEAFADMMPIGKFKGMEFGSVSNTNYQFGSSLSFDMYCDYVSTGLAGYSSVLGALFINGQNFPAPQPLARYGPSAYNLADYKWWSPVSQTTIFFNGSTYQGLVPPWYSPGKGNDSLNNALRACPYYCQSFSQSMGWYVYPANWFGNPGWDYTGSKDYPAWWYSQIRAKAIGSKTTYHVQSGSLAGATVTIELTNAMPRPLRRELDQDPWKVSGGTYFWNFGLKADTGGFANSLRLAYKVTIDKVPDSLSISSKWIKTTQVDVGLYENQGVENISVWASELGGKLTQPKGGYQWLKVPNGESNAYVSVNALPGTQATGAHTWNPDPIFEMVGDVSNGYVDPHPVSSTMVLPATKPLVMVRSSQDRAAIMEDAKQRWQASQDPNQRRRLEALYVDLQNRYAALDRTEAPGFDVRIPVNALGADDVGSSGAQAFFGGMSTLGVKARPLQIPLSYDLDGGSAQDPSLFPGLGQTQALTLNVETQPVVHIPKALPQKKRLGQPNYLREWKLLYENASGQLVDTHKSFAPGQSFDIRQTQEIGTRLSSKSGEAYVSKFVLKAVYEESAADTPMIYHVDYELRDNESGTTSTIQGPVFWGMKGLYVSPAPGAFPPTIEHNNKTYHLSASFTPAVVELGESSSLPYKVPYIDKTLAQVWAGKHSTEGTTASYPYGSEVDQAGLRKMLVAGDELPENVVIYPDPSVNTSPQGDVYPPQQINLSVTFSDGSVLGVVGFAQIELPPTTGALLNVNPLVLIGVLAAALMSVLSATLFVYRRQCRYRANAGKHARSVLPFG